MTKLAIGHVEHDSVIDLGPISVVRQEKQIPPPDRQNFGLTMGKPRDPL